MKNKKYTFDKFADLKAYMGNRDFNRPNEFGEDGVDHINVSISSKTQVGRFLDPSHNYMFEYPLIGPFSSVMALECWIKADGKYDEIRFMPYRTIARELKDVRKKKLDNYRAVVLLATYLKVKKNDDIVKQIKKLPKNVAVISYTVHKESGLRIMTNFAPNVLGMITEVVRAVQEDREPNYKKFLNRKNKNALPENGFLENTPIFKSLPSTKSTEVTEEKKEMPVG